MNEFVEGDVAEVWQRGRSRRGWRGLGIEGSGRRSNSRHSEEKDQKGRKTLIWEALIPYNKTKGISAITLRTESSVLFIEEWKQLTWIK